MAPPPCTCLSHSIHCDNKNLSHVPVFSAQIQHYSTINVYLQSNNLTSIPAYAFQTLFYINASRVNLYLSNNQIVNIQPHAFSGLEDAVAYINLENNYLTNLPLALAELSAVRELRLQDNPLTNLDAELLATLSNKLKTLTISIGNFSSFPNELNTLSNVSILTISHVQKSFLHAMALTGFENSLISLDMSRANTKSFPAAVCRLKILQKLKSNYSPTFGTYHASVFDKCTQPMTSVTHIELTHNQLKIFPNLSRIFPNLQEVDIRFNLLYFIESSTFSGMNFLTRLYIGYNKFTSVPSAINQATNLQEIHAYYNQIHTIHDYDFLHLHNLHRLYLAGNPLVSLSPHAFAHNPLLNLIRLDHTKLGRIPRAFLSLKRLNTFWLSGTPNDCSCSAMSYLKPWNASAIDIHATCSSGKPMKTFLTRDLPKCH